MLNGLIDQSDIIASLKEISEELLNDVVIKGIDGITNIIMNNISKNVYKNGDIETEKEWILETDGTNLLEVLNNEFIDPTLTMSNDIMEIYNLFGIEGARTFLINEIIDVIDEGAGYINSRHVELLCDAMTSKGFLAAINRQGINRGDTGPLAKCSFEDTTDQLIKAGIFGEKDKLNGVSSNIMMGQTIQAGTGMCELFLDERKLIDEMKDINLTPDDFISVSDDNIDTLLEDSYEEDDYCNDENFEMTGF